MNALLEMPEIREHFSPMSVADYHRLGEYNENGRRMELLRGVVIERMSKSPLHAYLITALRRILEGQMQPEWHLRQDNPLTTRDSEPEPDFAIVVGSPESFRFAHPGTAELAIEISVTSLAIDRLKASIYAEAGVKEYWIVLATEKQIEVYRQPSGGAYSERTMIAAPAILDCASLPGVRVDLAALFG